jgi:phage baseplate assembly protein W
MAELDFKDHYIGYPGHPKFQLNKIIEDDALRVIVQKYEMIIFTNKGELLGDPDFGCDLILLLHQTKISSQGVKSTIQKQIRKYIPELDLTNYGLEVKIFEDPERYQEVMQIDFKISELEVSAFIV